VDEAAGKAGAQPSSDQKQPPAASLAGKHAEGKKDARKDGQRRQASDKAPKDKDLVDKSKSQAQSANLLTVPQATDAG